MAIQDGIFAGQTIPHVHLHMLPFSPQLDQDITTKEKMHEGRSMDDLENEAKQYRDLF